MLGMESYAVGTGTASPVHGLMVVVVVVVVVVVAGSSKKRFSRHLFVHLSALTLLPSSHSSAGASTMPSPHLFWTHTPTDGHVQENPIGLAGSPTDWPTHARPDSLHTPLQVCRDSGLLPG